MWSTVPEDEAGEHERQQNKAAARERPSGRLPFVSPTIPRCADQRESASRSTGPLDPLPAFRLLEPSGTPLPCRSSNERLRSCGIMAELDSEPGSPLVTCVANRPLVPVPPVPPRRDSRPTRAALGARPLTDLFGDW